MSQLVKKATQLIPGYSDAQSAIAQGQANSVSAINAWKPTGFTTPGYTGTYTGNTFNLTPSADLTAATQGLSGAYGQYASNIGGLISQVKPGYGALTQSLVQANENARQRAIGNLRQNLQQRRILGSSFAQSSLANADLSYAQNEQNIRAQAFLQELNATQQLYGQQAQAQAGQYKTLLDQFNLDTNTAAQLSGTMSQTSAANQQLLAKLYEDYAGGQAALSGSIIGGITSGIGAYVGKKI